MYVCFILLLLKVMYLIHFPVSRGLSSYAFVCLVAGVLFVERSGGE